MGDSIDSGMRILALLAALPIVAAIQINPEYWYNYEIPGVCGRWKLGADDKHPPCRPIRSGGGGFHYETLSNANEILGPNVLAANEEITFGVDSVGMHNTFKTTTAYFDDPPCFTRKKYCANWNATTATCPVGSIRDCPPFQNRPGQCRNPPADGFSLSAGRRRGVQQGTAPYCVGLNCPRTACMDEEFYPGCAAFKAGLQSQSWDGKNFPGGTKQMTIQLEGTMTNLFGSRGASAQDPFVWQRSIADQTCDVLCPCKAPTAAGQSCFWSLSSDANKTYTCNAHQYSLWKRCQGCRQLHTGVWECKDSAGVVNPTLQNEDPKKAYGSTVNDQTKLECINDKKETVACTTYKVPFRDPKSELFNTPYTTTGDGKTPVVESDSYRALPVRFDVTTISVTPETAEQVTFLSAKCPCGGIVSWTKGTAAQLRTCTSANCHFFAKGGIFEDNKDLANCPAWKTPTNAGVPRRCLFSQMYRHQELFMYVGRMQPSFADMLFSTVHGMGIYTLVSVKPNCIKSDPPAKKEFPNVGYDVNAEAADAPHTVRLSAFSLVVASMATMMLLRDQ